MKMKANNKRSEKSVRTADTRTAGRAAMREQSVQEAYKEQEELTAD
ncbi:hypothetical protein [Geobacillus thermodenitrificans]|jgi:hypothetical protein|nr:hypothetical protein [Geobacillus thermodenitrificans]MED3716413.1 hypothetical protein [Geobacillus thermodenitrificans]MED3904983.1 hypothetical protein [Geobacillus thermodenitrificans]